MNPFNEIVVLGKVAEETKGGQGGNKTDPSCSTFTYRTDAC